MINEKYTDYNLVLAWLDTEIGISSLKKNRLLKRVANPLKLITETQKYKKAIDESCGEEVFDIIMQRRELSLLERLANRLEKEDVSLLSIVDENYPLLLKEIPVPPTLLYCKGDISLLKRKILGVVGTRMPTRYGIDVTTNFVDALSKYKNLVVCSGMARGIDTIAHKAALVNGPTIAVLGSGINVIYPTENKELYTEIIDKGLIISEYGLDVAPNSYQFPERNRLISGISKGVLVTEAGMKSGSLLTADYAVDQGKELFCIPSAINNNQGKGSNMLIKKVQGSIVTTPNDVAVLMGLDYFRDETISQLQLDFMENIIYEALNFEELHFEELQVITNLGVSELNSLLTQMEIMQIIKKLDNNYYGV